MWKINYCEDVVTQRDILPMEMLEWCRLIEQRAAIDDKLNNCSFDTWAMDQWKRGLTSDQLYKLYNGK